MHKSRDEVIHHLRAKVPHLKKDASDEEADAIAGGVSLVGIKSLLSIQDDLASVAKDTGDNFIGQLNVPEADTMFGQVNDRAVEYARARAADLVTQLDETTRDELRNTIASGLDDGVGLDEITDRIVAGYAFSEDRADLIARTEVAMANQQGALAGMREAVAHGVKLKKVWIPDAEACDECLDNADEGPIDLDAVFSTGDESPPAHPNCRCDMASDIEEPDNEDNEDEE